MMIHLIYSHTDHHELCQSLAHALSKKYNVNIDITNTINESNYINDDLYIFVDLHHYTKLRLMPKKYIIYNYQQLPYGRLHKFSCILDKIPGALAVWDYSKCNIECIKENYGFIPTYVPFGYTPTYELSDNSINNKTIEIGFIGYPSQRRIEILTRIKSITKTEIAFPNPPCYADDKYSFIKRCKIMLNIHKHGPRDILESSRLISYIANGAFIISEPSDDTQLMQDYNGKIIFCEASDMWSKCLDYLTKPEERLRISQDAYQWAIKQYKYEDHLPNITL